MSRILEGVFVLGCSLVGFSMSTGSAMQDTVQFSVHFVASAVSQVENGVTRAFAPQFAFRFRPPIMKHVF